MGKVIAVVNQKGGVGKTTSVINIGAGLAHLGNRVLLIDLDPQGNLTSGLGLEAEANEKNIYSVLIGERSIEQNICKSRYENLDLIPSDNNLAGAEIELVGVSGREYCLSNALTNAATQYNYIIIDCPPSLGLLTVNALSASDSFLIPLQAEFFAMQGLAHILRTTETIKKFLNPKLKEEGILLTMFDARSNFSKQVYREIKDFAGERLFSTVIPRRIKLAESTSHGKPGIHYDQACFGAKCYLDAAQELILRGEGKIIKNNTPFLPPDPADRIQKIEPQAQI